MECVSQKRDQNVEKTVEPWKDTLGSGIVCGIITGIGSAFGGPLGLFLAWLVSYAFILRAPSEPYYERPISRSIISAGIMIMGGSLLGFILKSMTG